jgi:hypothetical protein
MKILVTTCRCCTEAHSLRVEIAAETPDDLETIPAFLFALKLMLKSQGRNFTETRVPIEIPESELKPQTETIH